MISKTLGKSQPQLNKELLQAHFMDLGLLDENRFPKVDNLVVFMNDPDIMPAPQCLPQ